MSVNSKSWNERLQDSICFPATLSQTPIISLITHPSLLHHSHSQKRLSSSSGCRRRRKDRRGNRALGARGDSLRCQECRRRRNDLDDGLAVLGVGLCADGAAGHGRVDDLGCDDLRRGGDDDGGLVVLALLVLFGLGGQGRGRGCGGGARGFGCRC